MPTYVKIILFTERTELNDKTTDDSAQRPAHSLQYNLAAVYNIVFRR